ncbi:MAG TPA: PA14 domain-containing protein [Planctomycetota bacterium]|jgi:hypothetical protein|nr:PA14 domain-containing protein [Planctomycetota bacterium]
MSDQLLAKWVDDRSSLTEEEASELLACLEADPGLARAAKDQLLADELVSRRLAQDRAHFEQQVAQRLLSQGRDGSFLASTLDAVRRMDRRRAFRRWAAELAAALVLVAGLFFLVFRREASVTPASALRSGLRAEYFPNRDLRGVPVTRIDPGLDFTWAAGAGPIVARNDIFSARWTGKIQARVGGRTTLRVRHDDGVRVWIGTTPVIDDWKGRLRIAESRGELELEAGKTYDLRVEYFNGGDRGVLQLYWSAAGMPEELIPPSQFSHD